MTMFQILLTGSSLILSYVEMNFFIIAINSGQRMSGWVIEMSPSHVKLPWDEFHWNAQNDKLPLIQVMSLGHSELTYWGLWPLLLTWLNFNPSMDK